MGCNAEEVHDDWDDDKLLVLGVMYNYLNENILKPGQTICMTPEQIQTKTGIKDSASTNLILKHFSERTDELRYIDSTGCANGFKIDAVGRALG